VVNDSRTISLCVGEGIPQVYQQQTKKYPPALRKPFLSGG
jgi:hypothetical protein